MPVRSGRSLYAGVFGQAAVHPALGPSTKLLIAIVGFRQPPFYDRHTCRTELLAYGLHNPCILPADDPAHRVTQATLPPFFSSSGLLVDMRGFFFARMDTVLPHGHWFAPAFAVWLLADTVSDSIKRLYAPVPGLGFCSGFFPWSTAKIFEKKGWKFTDVLFQYQSQDDKGG